MGKHCEKCRQTVKTDDFLCPYCGHILGQPVYNATRQKVDRKIPWRQILLTFGMVVLIAAILATAWGISRLTKNMDTTAPTVPTTASTEPPTVAPLVSYHVKLTADTKYWIPGITVHFCKDGQELYSGKVEADGEITFVAPKGEGYSIRLSDLFPALDFHYGDAQIPFPEGSNTLNYHLENKDVQYTVRVVNTAGEPVPDVMVEFVAKSGQFIQQQVSDSNGESVFASAYDPMCYATVQSIPDEYVMISQTSGFEDGSFVTTIALRTYEECNIDSDHIFTVKFRDEYGQPVKDLYVLLYGQEGESTATLQSMVCFTNQQGCFTFAGDPAYTYQVRIPNNPDYSDKYFTFEPGSNELNVELFLHTPLSEYTYTVRFYNQMGEPIPGVTIFYEHNGEYFQKTSNEEGRISFPSVHKDPTQVKFRILSVPAGYKVSSADLIMEYTFKPDSRTLGVELEYQTVQYTVWVYVPLSGGENAGVSGVEFDILVGEERYSCQTKGSASCRVVLPFVYSVEQFSVELIELPGFYKDYVISDYTVGGDEDLRFIVIYISPPQELSAEEGTT